MAYVPLLHDATPGTRRPKRSPKKTKWTCPRLPVFGPSAIEDIAAPSDGVDGKDADLGAKSPTPTKDHEMLWKVF